MNSDIRIKIAIGIQKLGALGGLLLLGQMLRCFFGMVQAPAILGPPVSQFLAHFVYAFAPNAGPNDMAVLFANWVAAPAAWYVAMVICVAATGILSQAIRSLAKEQECVAGAATTARRSR